MPSGSYAGFSKRLDLTGQRYGRFVVVAFAEVRGSNAYWTVRCDCGTVKVVQGSNLRSGVTVSCGCYRKESARRANAATVTHGHTKGSRSRTYQSWQNMKRRCSEPAATGYCYYGAKGVAVCTRWQESFAAFVEDMGERPEGMTLDRIDPYGNYEPTNCRWADSKTQAANKRKANPLSVCLEPK